MKLQDMTLQQLKEIRDGAPDTNVTLSAESIENKGVDGSEKITVKLDPNKCSKVDPGLAYDSPGDCPKDDFDAMSEKHRSPSCKCHAVGEMPAVEPLTECELKSPVAASQQQIGGNHYTKLAIQPMHYSLANKLNAAQHTIIKYVTRYPDKGGIEDLLKARHTIDLLIEHLKGEQGE